MAASVPSLAQTSGAKPADATGQCKDGTYTTNPNKKQACSGHQGVKSWYQTVGGASDPDIKGGTGTQSKNARQTANSNAVVNPGSNDNTAVSGGRAHAINHKSGNAAVATPNDDNKTVPGPAAEGGNPAASGGRSTAARANRQAVPGGGPDKVWVNTDSKVYHCYGSGLYGKTKDGKYVSEQDAKQMGARPDHGKACSQ
ncbi:DUF3761 domain-containing protein [Acidobacteria bacterium AB60]|nr:DUF3761 domain-containing protein [Acidobacteria bacterium AB60]